MTTPAPPLTEAELSGHIATLEKGYPPPTTHTLLRIFRRALTLESELSEWKRISSVTAEQADAMAAELTQLRRVCQEIAEARRVDGERIGEAETALLLARGEIEELRREKAEREEIERRRDAWLQARPWRSAPHGLANGIHSVTLVSAENRRSPVGTGPTYEAALAAALEKVEKG